MSDPKRPDLAPAPGEVIPIRRPNKFHSSSSRLLGEREERLANAKRTQSFGVKFLDDALGGIFCNDLVLLGAKTGIGKTAMATVIAMANAEKGQRVHYLALEAESREITRRIKFSYLSEMVREGCRVGGSRGRMERMNYLDWYSGKLEDITGPLEDAVDRALAERFKTLHMFYREQDFTAEDFAAMVLEVQDETDLILLDHVHYVDSNDPSENRGYKQIVKTIRDTALRIGKPVIVVAHLRKGDRRSADLIPSLDDFHGTSDIAKIATKAVMIAPAHECESEDPWLWPTYLAPVKCRQDGSRTRYVGRTAFDARKGRYQEVYDLGRINLAGDKFELVDNTKLPRWAR